MAFLGLGPVRESKLGRARASDNNEAPIRPRVSSSNKEAPPRPRASSSEHSRSRPTPVEPPSSSSSFSSFGDVGELDQVLEPLSGAGLSEENVRETAYELLLEVVGAWTGFAAAAAGAGTEASKRTTAKRWSLGALASAAGAAPSPPPTLLPGVSADTLAVMRQQLKVTEAADQRARRALGQAPRESGPLGPSAVVVPVALLQALRVEDFANAREYGRFKARQLLLLEAGLCTRGGSANASARHQLRASIAQMRSAPEASVEGLEDTAGRALVAAADALAKREDGDGGGVRLWAAAYPLNVHLYCAMLMASLEPRGTPPGTLSASSDALLSLARTAAGALRLTPALQSACLALVLVRAALRQQQLAPQLLARARTELEGVAGAAEEAATQELAPGRPPWVGPAEAPFVSRALTEMVGAADSRLLVYREAFPGGGDAAMEALLGVALAADRALQAEQLAGSGKRPRNRARTRAMEPDDKCEGYIRSSMRTAFAQAMEAADSDRARQDPLMVALADGALALARSEARLYSPTLGLFHPAPAGTAAATLHACFRRELVQFLGGVTVLSADAAAALGAAARLEGELVQMAAADGMALEDGGKALMREMAPFDAENVRAQLAKQWVAERGERLKVCVERSLQAERWEGDAGAQCPGAVVDVAALLQETVGAFFSLGLTPKPSLAAALAAAAGRAVQRGAIIVTAPLGSVEKLLPRAPPVTRYKKEVFQKLAAERRRRAPTSPRAAARQPPRQLTPSGEGAGLDVDGACARIAGLHHLIAAVDEVESMLQRLAIQHGFAASGATGRPAPPVRKLGWTPAGAAPPSAHASRPSTSDAALPRAEDLTRDLGPTRADLEDGIRALCQWAAVQTVYVELRAPFVSELYAGGVAGARLEALLGALERRLQRAAGGLDTGRRDQLAGALLEACLDGVARALLAGGPVRAYTLKDADALDDDVEQLKDLFLADGEGLPRAAVEAAAGPVMQVLALCRYETKDLIRAWMAAPEGERNRALSSAGARRPSTPPPARADPPPGPLAWLALPRSAEAETLLRVLCYRADHPASKFLKEKYDIPKALK